MKIALATIQAPFIKGGAEYLIKGLELALINHGHTVEQISMPFRFSPPEQVRRSLEIWQSEDFTSLNGHQADLVICLQFPTYHVRHPSKVLWLMHQFRMVYDLWDTPFGHPHRQSAAMSKLRESIVETDTTTLAAIGRRFTIAENVSSRLLRYNGLTSEALYHPPYRSENFYNAAPENYILAPSRLEATKRQELLIRAMPDVAPPMIAVFVGEGGQRSALEELAAKLGVGNRVIFLGQVTEEEKWGLYAHSAGVFFAPYDEDYGYVTLEGMLSAKAVITCTDSGGPLEFVINQETGLIVEPEAATIAHAVNSLQDKQQSSRMGHNGRARYESLSMTWDKVVSRLTAK